MSEVHTTRVCKCGKEYSKPYTTSKREWAERYKSCSKSCAAKLRGNAWLKPHQAKLGKVYGKATRFTKQQTEAESNFQWKGDKASYAAKHMWVRYHFGKANHCDNCLADDRTMYHWSNISGDYQRDRDDWQQLCVPCHKRYDLARVN